MRVISVVALALAAATPVFAQSPLNDVQLSNIDNVLPPSFELTNVTVSFYMRCTNQTQGVCFLADTTKPGVFARNNFAMYLVEAFNSVAVAERARQAGSTNADTEAGKITTSSIIFNRVVEETNPFESPSVKALDTHLNAAFATGADYWNVFVRFTLVNVAVEMADLSREVVGKLQDVYSTNTNNKATILFDSLWVDREAAFLNDRFEPVPGRGHKDQQLVIPLVLGIFMMLAIPTFVSWLAVQYAKERHQGNRRAMKRDRVIEHLNDDLVTKNTTLEQNKEVQEKREEDELHEQEMARLRDHDDLDADDVDWDAKKPVAPSLPYGDN
eukprot:TRINITY_DN1577_c0_g1_i1.p2 TRINITY_DN1577_c0_g1~~TRINITY_DN1577_c0_g1_i1.p2  ORF type:complete len:328 (+),score=152.64 TRINITY_DN1577_c0_g1_i1:77-1060(+)